MNTHYLTKTKPIERINFGPIPPEIITDRRSVAEEETARDLTKSYEQLLADAHEEVTDPSRPPDVNLGFSNRRLASIFARTAISSEKATAENLELQRKVATLTTDIHKMTAWLKGLTIVLTVLTAVSMYSSLKQLLFDIIK